MSHPDDSRLEQMLGRLLRLGVAGSTLGLAIGLVSTLTGYPGSGQLLLQIGVLVLLATPMVRVAVSAASYARQRDWLFAGLVAIVFLELLAGLIASLQGPSG